MKWMPIRSRSRPPFATLALALAATVAFATSACDDSTGPDEETLVGTWDVTTFVVLGTDYIPAGMSIAVTFTGSATSGTYQINIQNASIDLCDGSASCVVSGDFEATSTQITLDPDDPEGSTVFTYAIQGSTMTWAGDIDGTPVTVTLDKR